MTSARTHSTNYYNSFISVSPDSKAGGSLVPGRMGSIAALHYALLASKPYHHTSDDVLFIAHCRRSGLDETDELARAAFFSKGQACLRCSPLVKSHGWGLHHDDKGRVALVAQDSADYQKFMADKAVKQLCGMRSAKAKA